MQQDNCPWHVNALQAKWVLTHRAPKVQKEGSHRLPTGYSWLGPNYTDILLLGATQGKKICQKKLLQSNLKFVQPAPFWETYKGMKKSPSSLQSMNKMTDVLSPLRMQISKGKKVMTAVMIHQWLKPLYFTVFPKQNYSKTKALKQIFKNIHWDSL